MDVGERGEFPGTRAYGAYRGQELSVGREGVDALDTCLSPTKMEPSPPTATSPPDTAKQDAACVVLGANRKNPFEFDRRYISHARCLISFSRARCYQEAKSSRGSERHFSSALHRLAGSWRQSRGCGNVVSRWNPYGCAITTPSIACMCANPIPASERECCYQKV